MNTLSNELRLDIPLQVSISPSLKLSPLLIDHTHQHLYEGLLPVKYEYFEEASCYLHWTLIYCKRHYVASEGTLNEKAVSFEVLENLRVLLLDSLL